MQRATHTPKSTSGATGPQPSPDERRFSDERAARFGFRLRSPPVRPKSPTPRGIEPVKKSVFESIGERVLPFSLKLLQASVSLASRVFGQEKVAGWVRSAFPHVINFMYKESMLKLLSWYPVRKFLKPLTSNWCAGENKEEAAEKIMHLHDKKIRVIANVLGEHYTRKSDVDKAVSDYSDLVAYFQQKGIAQDGEWVSSKGSQLGLWCENGEALFAKNAREVASRAVAAGYKFALDMEGAKDFSATVLVYRMLVEDFGEEKIGIVLQANQSRSHQELLDILNSYPLAQVRICKGAYPEDNDLVSVPSLYVGQVSFLEPSIRVRLQQKFPKHGVEAIDAMVQKEMLVEANVRRMIDLFPYSDARLILATHDDKLLDYALARTKNLELQVLYGVRQDWWENLISSGKVERVYAYLPEGAFTAAYSIRRIRKNPKGADLLLEGLLQSANLR